MRIYMLQQIMFFQKNFQKICWFVCFGAKKGIILIVDDYKAGDIMKEIRSQFSAEEYESLKADATHQHVSLRQLVHDRAMNPDSGSSPLHDAQVLSDEMSQIRNCMNRIIRRETNAEVRLYEDDVIALEQRMTDLERLVSDHIKKGVKNNGQSALQSNSGAP